VTRFTKDSEEWIAATYYDVRTGKPCRITTGESTSKDIIPVRSYRSILNAYVNNAESKFDGQGGKQCCSWARGMLQRMHVVAGRHRYCGKEMRRKLEQGPVDHEVEFKCKVYENWRVVATSETLRQLAGFSEREIAQELGCTENRFGCFGHGGTVTRRTYHKIATFLREQAGRAPEHG